MGVFLFFINSENMLSVTDNQTQTVEQNQSANEAEITPTKPEYDFESASSIHVLVNKENSLPLNYVPNLSLPDVPLNTAKSESELSVDTRIIEKVEQLFADAKKADLEIMLASAYRSVELQDFYYTNYVNTYSQEEADKFSAKPGHSEHQTGLAIDIAELNDNSCYLEQCFAATEAGEWLKSNAHRYGFILRYPKDESDITGYQFEPWHFRYVGKNVAKVIYEQELTFEEFYQNSLEE